MSRASTNAMKAKVLDLLSVEGEARTRELLDDFGTPAAINYLGRVLDERFTRRLLDAREPRAAICVRLQARGLAPRTAQRVIGDVLRQRAPSFGTRPAHD